ncbi:sigma-70 family RNA polymerase sigma factor [Fredinandcohnia sp. 179-A 10B2 NHS]|uniref:sigma-70 family RNA polymerase sigma factor n=1 Tax=Fredinandcohnia sp. 179-A 10B2 NHS TaxID=3235176 RepID=UPI0039A1378C
MKNSEAFESLTNELLIEKLIDEYSDMVKRLSYTYVKDWQVAEDITQEVFIACYKSLGHFRKDCSYKNWIYKININKCKDFLKGKWLVPKEFLEKLFLNENQKSLSTEERVMLINEERILSQNVLSLPVRYREIIILYYYEDMKMKEISDLTGLHIATIKTRLSRAKKILRKIYEGV